MKRILSFAMSIMMACSVCFFSDIIFVQEDNIAEAAQVEPQLAQRELKKSKNYQVGSAYERAHKLIYGENPPIGPGNRPRIAVIVNGDENLVVEDRVKNEIYSQLRQKFPREYFALMKGTDVNTKLLQYAEETYYNQRGTMTVTESGTGSLPPKSPDSGAVSVVLHGVTDFLFGKQDSGATGTTVTASHSDKVDVDGLPVAMQPRGLADMRREDFVRAGHECGYDYVFVATLTQGKGRDARHNFVLFNSVTNYQNVWLRLRFVDVQSGDYLYRNDIAVQGKAHNGSRTGRVYQRAVHKAMQEAMNDIEIVR